MRDLGLDKDCELSIINGDFYTTQSDEQHIEMILTSNQGEWKENPSLGVNLINSKAGNINRFLKRSIIVQLEADGFNVDSIKIEDTGIEVNGQYRDTNK